MNQIKFILIISLSLFIEIGAQGQEIFDAVRVGDIAKVRELIEKDPKLVAFRNANQINPLHVAAVYGRADIARFLIEKGAEINPPDESYYSPLMFAGIEVAKLLVENGADVNYRLKSGWSALAEALSRGRIEVAEYLIESGFNIPDPMTPEGTRLLISALKAGCIKYFEKCMDLGLNPTFESEARSNLIHFAAESNSTSLVTMLIDLGVPVNKTNIYGWNPLHYAAFGGNKYIVDLLIGKGIDKNARTTEGKSPYNLASESMNTPVINYLDSIGADKSPQQFPVINGEYLGQDKPGKKAVPFAPGILAAQYNYHSSIAFTPDGNELYGKSMMPMRFLYSKRIDGHWSIPDTLTNMNNNDVPFISPDGRKMYYLGMQMVQGQPPKELIYDMDKTPTGWSEPSPVSEIINSIPGIHWQLSVDRKGNLYFGARQNGTLSSRIYCSEYLNGSYTEPQIMQNLKDVDAHSPYISPDGSYLIISTFKELFILFRKNDGNWTKEKSLTDIIGCEGNCPIVTHDGKYMFFVHNIGDKYIPYWVSAKIIDELRPTE